MSDHVALMRVDGKVIGAMFETCTLHDDFGVEVFGVDLAVSLPDAIHEALYVNLCRHGVMLFRGQTLKPEHQIDFMSRFCRIRSPSAEEKILPGFSEISILGNVVENGEPIGFQHKLGIEWHTDGTGWPQPTLATCLYGVEVPHAGGDTLYAGMYAAYDKLPDDLRERVDGLNAIYSRVHLAEQFAKGENAPNPMSDAERERFPDQIRPLVNVHPVTGRKALLVSIEECRELEGMDQDSSRRFNQALLGVITAPDRVYRHRWRTGDLVVWDNRCMLHSPTPYTYADQRRRLHRVIGLEMTN